METIIVNLNNVQETLVSGTNIKTINGNSLLGSGNIIINSDNIYTANGTITDAERVVSLIGDGLTDKLIVANDTGVDFFQLTGAKTASIGEYYAPTISDRLTIGTVGMTNGINIVGTGTNGISINSTGEYGLLTSNKYGVTSISSTANGYGVYGEVNAGAGTNSALKGVATTANTGTNIAIELSASNGSTNWGLRMVSGDIKISHATQNVLLNDNTSGSTWNFQNSSGANIMTIAGNSTVGINITPNIAYGLRIGGSNSYGLNISGSQSNSARLQSTANSGKGLVVTASGNNSEAIQITGTGSSGTCYGVRSIMSGSATTNKGIELNVTGATNNYAIDIVAGDIKTPSGIGQIGTYTFGGGGSGDIASMQFENGILIATTLVP